MICTDDLIFPDFNDIEVSTRTFTAITNLVIDLDELFQLLPITEYIEIPKRRGRKKKEGENINPNKHINPGSIITLKYKDSIRGVSLKKKKASDKKWFRNSFTVVIVLDKHINFKVCRNGTFQMTGCKTIDHALQCVQYIWKYIKDQKHIYNFSRNNKLEVLFAPAMRNIDFSLGFKVDREKLAQYMATTDFPCLLEISFGYTGVNIKIPLEKDITELEVTKMTDVKEGYNTEIVDYKNYLDLLSDKDRRNKMSKIRYNTFLVFHSGKVIMSGINEEFMRDVYYDFLKIIRSSFDKIEERLD
jgi:TATA-box binding protein (TBP) (component of TFIID and TFIIIB)